MDRTQLTPELLKRAEWFCEFGLLVADVFEAHPTWTQNEIAQLSGASYEEMSYWVGLVFQAVDTWQQIRQKRVRREKMASQ